MALNRDLIAQTELLDDPDRVVLDMNSARVRDLGNRVAY
jgi:hypothetical protein